MKVHFGGHYKEQMSSSARSTLNDFYQAENELLYELAGDNYNWT